VQVEHLEHLEIMVVQDQIQYFHQLLQQVVEVEQALQLHLEIMEDRVVDQEDLQQEEQEILRQ
jgi:hypothetical protein